jgi:mRNA interferase MazF
VFVVVSRQAAIDSKFSTVICAPVYSTYQGLSSQISVGTAEGLKHDSAIHCDQLVSIIKPLLTDFVGRLGQAKQRELNEALAIAVGLK